MTENRPVDKELSGITNLVDLLNYRVQKNPDKATYIFLEDGENIESRLTYKELQQKSQAIAVKLLTKLKPGDRALLLYPSGLDYITAFFGCLHAGVIAVPVYPPNPAELERSMARLQTIVRNAEPGVILTTSPILDLAKGVLSKETVFEKMEWVATDEVPENLASDWKMPRLSDESIAFLQYTSGSTGDPKGVMVSHGNVLYNQEMMKQAWIITEESVTICWLPLYHDMGLIGNVLQSVYCGSQVVLMSPIAFLQKPVRWLQAVSRYKATDCGAPNFAYELLINRIASEKDVDLDLSTWKMAINAAEFIRSETLKKFGETFSPYGFNEKSFYPCYGIAEATVFVSGGIKAEKPLVLHVNKTAFAQNKIQLDEPGEEEVQSLVGCGRTWLEQKIIIADPESLTMLPDMHVGEIWLSGKNITRGYWNNPEETEKAYNACLADTGEGPFFRTGDTGFMHDGELFVTGRLKDMIIIRGQNHYPNDIEMTVENSHQALRAGCTAAFSVDAEGEERLVVVQEVRKETISEPEIEDVLDAIRTSVSENHELQIYSIVLIKPRTIFKTSSGKIQRGFTKDAFLKGTLETISAWQKAEIKSEGLSLPSVEHIISGSIKGKNEAIQLLLIEMVAEKTGISRDRIDINRPFMNFGIDSLSAVEIAAKLESLLGQKYPATLIYNYPNIEMLSRYLAGSVASQPEDEAVSIGKFSIDEPIAIIGMACRLPGSSSIDEFWNVLLEGRDTVTEIPEDRRQFLAFDDVSNILPDGVSQRTGGFLEDIDCFDAEFFDIAPREAVQIDPQQRLMMELSWEVMEDAGVIPEKLRGRPIGVFMGAATNDFGQLLMQSDDSIDAYTNTGVSPSIISNRISYQYHFQGPSISVNTICSSSLVAVHLAVNSIRNGECEMAMAGGVNVILTPKVFIGLARQGVMSPDGHCRPFDADARGIVRSEGAGIILLKPLSKAMADRDHVYGMIRGSAVMQDGRSAGIMAPSGPAQEKMIEKALQNSGIRKEQVRYVETHGTGTILGDPIEAVAVGNALGKTRPADEPLYIGSVKSNLGHTEAAGGLVSLIKAALMVKNRMLVPSIHFNAPNPHIPFDDLQLKVPVECSPWPEKPAVAGVSSLSLGGTNVHVIIEEPPVPGKVRSFEKEGPGAGDDICNIFLITAHSREALGMMANQYVDFLSKQKNNLTGDDIYNICFTNAVRRGKLAHKAAVAFRNTDQLIENMKNLSAGKESDGLSLGQRGLLKLSGPVFLFSGHAPNLRLMSRWLLYRGPASGEMFRECDGLFSQFHQWSLIEELEREESSPLSDDAEFLQAALFTARVSLAALYRACGVMPGCVMGSGQGETAAACVAGVLTLQDAVRVVYESSRIMKGLAVSGGTVAAEGGPLEQAIQELNRALHDINPGEASIPVYSAMTGKTVTGPELTGEYWGRNLRAGDNCSESIENAVNDGHVDFLEIVSHQLLKESVSLCCEGEKKAGPMIRSVQNGGDEELSFLSSLGELYTRGFPVDFSVLYPHGRHIRLPAYPFQKIRYWPDQKIEINHSKMEKMAAESSRQPQSSDVPAQSHPGLREKLTASSGNEAKGILVSFIINHLAEVLQYPAGQITTDTPLGMLGVDSIMVMELLSYIGRDLSLNLSTDRDFQEVDISRMADGILSEFFDSTAGGEPDQGKVKGQKGHDEKDSFAGYSLTPPQHWFFEHKLSDPHHWNTAVLLDVAPVNLKDLRKSIELVTANHGVFNLRFSRENNEWKGTVKNDSSGLLYKEVDLSHFSDKDIIGELEGQCRHYQGKINITDGPLICAVYFKLGRDRGARLLIIMHHLVSDGYSWLILLRDILQNYSLVKDGKPISPGSKHDNYIQWACTIKDDANSKQLEDELEYWINVHNRYKSRIPLDFPDGVNTEGSADKVIRRLTKKETRFLLTKNPQESGAGIEEVLMASMARAFKTNMAMKNLLIETEGHGRDMYDVDLSETIGWCNTFYPVLLKPGSSDNPLRTVASIRKDLQAIPRRGRNYGLLRYMGEDRKLSTLASQPEVKYIYHGRMFDQNRAGDSLLKQAPESSGLNYGTHNTPKHLIYVYGLIRNSRLEIEIVYSKNLHKKATIKALADALLSEVRGIIDRLSKQPP